VDRVPFPLKPLSAFVAGCAIDENHSDWSEAKYQCHFDLHFSYGQGHSTFLHVFIGHLYFFF
jgi:hypothetical protein